MNGDKLSCAFKRMSEGTGESGGSALLGSLIGERDLIAWESRPEPRTA